MAGAGLHWLKVALRSEEGGKKTDVKLQDRFSRVWKGRRTKVEDVKRKKKKKEKSVCHSACGVTGAGKCDCFHLVWKRMFGSLSRDYPARSCVLINEIIRLNFASLERRDEREMRRQFSRACV